jgi:Family of unknown function (DUF6483)
MIRRDYILRMVQEMVQLLARVVFLKSRREYEQALHEINRALRQLNSSSDQSGSPLEPEEWVALCRKHDHDKSGLMMATAELLRQEGELLALQERRAESQRSRITALTLFLEAILTGETFISTELLDKVEQLADETAEAERPPALWLRLVRYFEAREQFALAEDAVFGWVETGDPNAKAEGLSFYERLLAKNDFDLSRSGLPRSEVEQGRDDLRRAQGAES